MFAGFVIVTICSYTPRGPKLTDMLLTYKGEILSIADWAKRAGLSAAALYGRIFLLGWPAVMALHLRSFEKSPHKLSRRVLRATRQCLEHLQHDKLA